MGTPIVEGANTSGSKHSLSGHEPEDVNSASSPSSSPVTSEEEARQIKAAIDPLTRLIRQLGRLCNLMKELRQAPAKRFETSNLIQGPSRAHSNKFDKMPTIFYRIH